MSRAPDAGEADAEMGEKSVRARQFSVEQLLAQAIRMTERARPMPFSTSVMVNGDELLGLLKKAQAALPEEMRAARWVLKEREDLKARVQQEGEEIIAAARARAQQMVQRSEVAKAAEQTARRTLAEAQERSTRMKLETEDWCDQRLAAFESTLQKTLKAVSTGRERLQDTRLARPAPPPAPPPKSKDVFDQDENPGQAEA